MLVAHSLSLISKACLGQWNRIRQIPRVPRSSPISDLTIVLLSMFLLQHSTGLGFLCDIFSHALRVLGSPSASIASSRSLPPLSACLYLPYCPCLRYMHSHVHKCTHTCTCAHMHTQDFPCKKKHMVSIFIILFYFI